ncbi:gliding motility-associated C-terminal domain-containing protein [Chitinophaga nivalis]|uniref:Gliding motility-associated C-terminal domain-containing protein n=1 Tax=Chitinophaga nivalis TaxID=2991709 RepID=A0ABT3IN25_9BACT|nr:gliding motility-associated C-terminal domain-containing protein [Chitinophaga nivalis]MCW3464945.1 gliding motility-associated C-terminal domain-containing protein [Chitinophaga nivalis]MCW3485363.1 gliding motility-associated C-terminal domain-containing protein [Chitinophaga nivalis]
MRKRSTPKSIDYVLSFRTSENSGHVPGITRYLLWLLLLLCTGYTKQAYAQSYGFSYSYSNNNIVRIDNVTGNLTNIHNFAPGQITQATALATDLNDDLYFTDKEDPGATLYKFVPNPAPAIGGTLSTIAAALPATFNDVNNVARSLVFGKLATNTAGELFTITNYNGGNTDNLPSRPYVIKLDKNTGAILSADVIPAPPPGVMDITVSGGDIDFSPSGRLFVCGGFGSSAVLWEVDAVTAAIIASKTVPIPGSSFISGIGFDLQGNLVCAASNVAAIVRINASEFLGVNSWPSTSGSIPFTSITVLNPAPGATFGDMGSNTFRIVGRVFEDVNYGGGAGRPTTAAGVAGIGNARVEVYDAAGNLENFTTTTPDGYYAIGLNNNGTYYTRVANGTLRSSRPGSNGTELGIQTFRQERTVSTVLTPISNEVGGRSPATTDPGSGGIGTTTLNTTNFTLSGSVSGAAASVSQVVVGSRNADNIDFGFNFSTIVNVNDAGQGSLRQFIINSNVLGNTGLDQVANSLFDPPAGEETSIFMIPDGTAHPGINKPSQLTAAGGGSTAIFNIATALPAITDAATTIDGRTQTANIGNSQPGVAGHPGALVGVDQLTLPGVQRPEVEIHSNGGVITGLIGGPSTAIRNIAIYGFGTGTAAGGNILLGANNICTENIIGGAAISVNNEPAGTNPGSNIFVGSIATNIINNIITRADFDGIEGGGVGPFGVRSIIISGNEILNNGNNTAAVIGIDGSGISGGRANDSWNISNNSIADNGLDGIVIQLATTVTILNNTIPGNGAVASPTPAQLSSLDNVMLSDVIIGSVSKNIVTGAGSAGISVTGATTSHISQNSTYNNAGLGIDLRPDPAIRNLVLPNDNGDADAGPNQLLNFPVFTAATIVGNNLVLKGFSGPGTTIELFLADRDGSFAPTPPLSPNPLPPAYTNLNGFGEGRTFLLSLKEGGTVGGVTDLDGSTGIYTDDGTGTIGNRTANKFLFKIPLSSLPGTILNSLLTATATDVSISNTSEFSGVVRITAADMGDAPDSYKTLSVSDGPAHAINLNLKIGATVAGKTEAPAVAAGADANPPNGDLNDDGFTPPLPVLATTTTTYTLTFPVTNTTGATANLAGWVDFNRNGVFDATEGITATVANNATTGTLIWNNVNTLITGSGASGGITYARIRLTTDPLTTADPAGFVTDGEVEDYSLMISALTTELHVKKTADKVNVKPGDNVTFTITVSNTGTKDTLGVQVQELPAGFTYSSNTAPTAGTYNSGTGIWTLDVLQGETHTLQLVLTANATGPYMNVVSTGDPNNPNDPKDTTRFVSLRIKKTTNKENVKPGDNVTFTITLDNVNGTKDSLGVQVLELPQGLTYVSSTQSAGTYNSGTGIWTVDALQGQTATLTLLMSANATGPYSNIASVGDPNNPDNARDTVKLTALSITKTADKVNVKPGDNVTFTITLKNDGAKDSLGVQVLELPQGLTFVSSTPSAGTYNSGTGIWTVDALQGQTATLTLVMTANATGPYSNIASVGDPNNPDNPRDSVQFAALSITKTANKANVKPGDNVTFTITLKNDGTKDSLGVQVLELPQGLTYVSSTPSAGTYNSGTGIWTVDALQGQTATLTLLMSANATGPYSNIASVGDPNNPDNARDTVKLTALSITKTADKVNVKPGDNVTFTITLKNDGAKDSLGVQVLELPQGLTFVSSTPSAGTYNSGTGIWTVDALQGQSATLTLVMAANAAGPYSNIASVGDPNNPDNARDTVELTALSITKTANKTNIKPGDQVTFTITLKNDGARDSLGVQVLELPEGLTYVSSTPSAGTYNSGTGIWTVDALQGQTATLTLVMTANAVGPYSNVASVGDPNNPDNPRDSVQFAALSITKTANKANVKPGDQVTFTVTLKNDGTKDSLGVQVLELPQGLTFVSSTPSAGTYNSGTGIWTVDALQGQSATLTLVMSANAAGPYSNLASVGDPNNPDNARDTVELTALSITKTANKANIKPGDQVTFTITLKNDGARDSLGVQVLELPEGLTYVSSTPSAGTYNSGTGIWTVDALQGQTATLTLVMTANAVGPYSNVASVGDPNNPDNPRDSVQFAALSITKTANKANVKPGDQVTFTVTLKNDGTKDSLGVQVLELPQGLTFVSSTPSAGTYNSGTGIWTVDALQGQSATLTLVMSANAAGPYSNLASVGDPNNPDNARDTVELTALSITKTANKANIKPGDQVTFTITLKNDGARDSLGVQVLELPEGLTYVSSTPSAGTYNSGTGIWTVDALQGQTATLTLVMSANATGPYSNVASVGDPNNPDNPRDSVQFAALSITKTANKANVKPGDQVTFTVTLRNDGTKDSLGVQVLELPQGLTYVSSTPTSGTYNSGSGIWTVDALKGQSATLTLVMSANAAGPYSNLASVGDPNNPDNARDTVELTALSITKTANKANIKPGDQVTFTITLKNDGARDSLGVQVLELPEGLTYVSSTPSAGTYNSGTGIWTVDALQGQTATLTLVMSANATGPYSNVASVGDPNNPDNPRDSVQFAALSITKIANKANVKPGDQVTFTVTLKNDGTKDSLGVQVLELPQGLTYVSSTPTSGTYNSGSGIWTVDALKGQSATLTLVMSANAAGPYSNLASVGDPNNPDNARDTVELTALSITKTANKANVKPGDQVTFTITLKNDGAKDSLGVQVFELPEGLTYVSSTPSAGTYNSGTGIWTVDALQGQTATLTLVMTANAAGPYSNIASVGDPNNPDNPRDSVQFAALSITKTANKANVKPGDQVTFTVTLKNDGTKDSLGVQVLELPQGLTYVSSTPTSGTYNSGSGIWTVDALKGQSATLTLVMSANAAGPYSNLASVGDPNNPDNARDTVELTALSITKTANKENVKPGDNVTFTITLKNDGAKDSLGVQVFELPEGLTYVSSTPSAGTYNSGTGIWTVDALQSQTATLTLVMSANATGPYGNVASIGDPSNPDNPRDTVELTALSITKTADKANVKPGDQVTFTVTLRNNGTKDSLGVQVLELPQGLTYVSSAPTAGTYNSGTGIWTVDALKGQSATLTLVMTANATGPYGNVASVGDPNNPDNPRDTVELTALSITKTADKAAVKPGDQVTFTVTLRNDGTKDSLGVQVFELPEGLTYVSSAPSAGTYNSGTGIWTVDALKGQTATLTLVMTANATGPYGNVASIGDPSNPDNPRDSVQFAALSITKTANKANVKPGDQVTFTVTLKNDGTKDSLGVQVLELPQGLTYVSSTPSAGTYNSGTGIWTVDALKGQTATLTLVMTANATGPYGNVASVGDPNNPDNPRDTVELTALSITKTADKAAVKPGDQVTFTVTLRNDGTKDSLGVQVLELPQGLTYVSSAPSAGTYNSGTGIWTVDALKGQTATLTLVMTANATGPYGNVASIGDPSNPDNPRDSVQFAALSITKTANKANVKPGDQVTFTVTLKNDGTKDSLGVQVLELPQGLTYVSSAPSAGTYNSGSGIWTVDALKGQSATLTLVMTANATGPYGNVVSVGDPNNPDNPRDTVELTALSITKTANKAAVKPGDNVTFTVTLRNNGTKDSLGVQVLELPQGLTFVSSTPSAGTYNSGSGIWTVDALKGQTATLTLVMTANATGPYGNVASIGDPSNPDNPRDSVQFAALSITKTANKANVKPGDQVTFTVTLRNDGTKDSLGVQVLELPQGLTYVSSTPSAGTYNSGSGIWTVDALKGQSATLTLVMTANATGPYGNVASVGDPNNPDNPRDTVELTALSITKTADKAAVKPGDQVTFTVTLRNDGTKDSLGVQVLELPQGLTYVSSAPSAGTYNNGTGIWTVDALKGQTATLTLVMTANATGPYGNVASIGDPSNPDNPRDSVQFAALSIAKTANKANVKPGDQVTFTVTLRNDGTKDSLGVQVLELPQGLTYVSSTPSAGTYNSGTGIWTVDALKGQSATLTLVMTANATGPYGNVASVGDPNNPDNPRDSVQFAALSITKTANKANVKPGDQVTFTVTLRNDGTKDSLGVQVLELPQGLTYVSSAPSAGTYNSGSGIWTVDALKGQSATLTLVMTANATGPYGNIASIGDPSNPDNPRDTVELTALSITKTADKAAVKPGDNVTFTVTLRNDGTKDSLGVQVLELPQGLTYVSSTPSAGTYNSGTGIWTVDALKGQTATLTLVMKANATGPYGNVASIGDPSNPDNPRDSVQFAALSIRKTADKASVKPGDNVTFTVTLRNDGAKDSLGVQVFELPQGLTYVSSNPSAGTYNNGTGIWTVDALKGQSATLTLVMTANATGPYGNVASIGDPSNPDNPRDSVQFAALSIRKTADKASVKPGDQVTFTVTLGNNGTRDSLGVRVFELPQGLTYVSSTSSAGTYNNGTGIWTVDALKGQTATLTLVMKANATGPYGNVASIGDPNNPDNPRDSVRFAALSIRKTADKVNVKPGDNVTFTVTLSNNGTKDSLGVRVFELPQGLTYVSSAPSAGTYNSGTGIWTVDILKGQTATLTLVMKANATGPYGNVASIGDPNNPDNPRDSVRFAALSIRKTADKAVVKPGDDVTFTITLGNINGTKDSLGVQVFERPQGFTYVSSAPSSGTYNNGTGIWTVDALKGRSATLTLVMKAGAVGPYTNVGSIGDPDNPANERDSVIISGNQSADLSVVKQLTANPASLVVGKNASFTILVTNKGPNPATGVVVSDVIPDMLYSPIDIITSAGEATYDVITKKLTWRLNTLAVNEAATLQFSARIISGGNLINTATVKGNEPDPDAGNNTSSTTGVTIPDDLFIPNVITPNGDGKNDRFVIPGLEKYPGSGLYIYNRWGNMVYQSKDYDNKWTGDGLNEGTYYYILKLNTPQGERNYKGWIELLR